MELGVFLLMVAVGLILLNGAGRNDPIVSAGDSAPFPDEPVVAGDRLESIVQAIARAEGYGKPGAIPTVRNNPGDLESIDGQIKVFMTPDEGWNALRHQVDLMATGQSRIYQPDMTWVEIASHYDGETQPDPFTGQPLYMQWAQNVAQILGVNVNSTLADYVNS
jgi:hypothetical protein